MKKLYYEVKISAENMQQAETIVEELLKQKCATGGQFFQAPIKTLWKGKVVDMQEYVTILTYTTESLKDTLLRVVDEKSEEELPMVTCTLPDDLSSGIIKYIDRELR